MQRPFTSGSRQAPDPFDQFLEENNFYRKHTARDSSCLFRVISEQMFDTQLHHLAIRKKCVRYMRKHHEYFQALVERDLDEYLDDMSKPKTYGTLVELQAAGYMFQRNVLLFEPFNLGFNFFSNRAYFNEVFRIFYTPERHFDSVFTCDYIKDAAMCQSICYEILYKDLYKLPDVSFAVEHMLHSPIYQTDEFHSEFNEDGYCLRIEFEDGRTFDFDLPNDTNCILENYKLCHFHYTNFPRLSDDLQREMKINNNRDEYDKNALCKTAESLLPNKYVSCVRQLLNEGITPFPYKVAKALDPNMYRNIEFDAWNEHRKELKLQNWYSGDSNFKYIRCQQTRVQKIFQVGAKCHVKLCKSENDLYTCHIQEIAVDKGYCIVFIEQLGEKRMVPYDSLTPLPPDQFQPWSIPYRFQRQMQKYSSVRLTRHYNYRFKFNEQFSSTHEYMKSPAPQYCGDGDVIPADDVDPKQQQHYAAAAAAAHHHRSGCYYKLKQYTHLENFRTHTVEYCTMPMTVEHLRGGELDAKGVSGGGAAGAGQRATVATTTVAALTNENSSRATRAITPASTAGAVSDINGGGMKIEGDEEAVNVNSEDLIDVYGMEQAGGIAAGANIPPGSFILPDFQCFYQMPPTYAMPEDYYSYGYDPNMHPPATTFVPAGNGSTFYYYTPTANNIYMPGPPIMQGPPAPPLISAAVPAAAAANCYAQSGSSGGYYHNPGYGGSSANAAVSAVNSNSHSSSRNNTPSVVGRGYAAATTPLSGRINMEAKKSVKVSGTDLPADVATLRHFYNLGLEYHHIIQKRKQEESIESWKENVGKIMGDCRSSKADENGNVAEHKPIDTNNSSAANGQKETPSNLRENIHGSNQTQSHYNSNKPNHPNRRFSSRYFNSNKDRPQNYQRNQQQQGGGGNNANSIPSAMQQNRQQNDYNTNKNNKNNIAHNGTPNAARHHHMQHQQNVGTAPCVGLAVAEPNIQNSPMISYEVVNMGPAGDAAHTPHAYNTTPNPIITYGAYDYAATDPNGMQLAPIPANAAAASGVYIQMPIASAPYGLTYAPQPPPPMHAAASAGGQFHSPYMAAPPPPTVAAANMTMHPPPTQNTNGFYGTTGGPTDVNEYVNVINSDGIQCMAYPPPIPFYYAPNAVVGGGGGTPSNNGVGVVAHQQAPPPPLQPTAPGANAAAAGANCAAPPPQGYWCAPPPNKIMPTQEPLPPPPPSKGTTATTTPQSRGDGSNNNCNKTSNINGNVSNTGTGTQNCSGAANHRHREKQHQSTTTN